MSDGNGYDFDDPIYAQLEKEARQDTRVGDHEFLVAQVTHDQWPDGQPRYKIRGVLVTANNAKADVTLGATPTPEEVKAGLSVWDKKRKAGVTMGINMNRALAKFYKKSPEKISEGDTFKVTTNLSKRNPDGTGGFVRVVAFLDPSKELGAKAKGKKTDSDVPF